jgi:pilus assembly protein CpaC
MKMRNTPSRVLAGASAVAMTVASLATAAPLSAMPLRSAQGQASTYQPTRQVLLSVGEGQLISLPTNVTDVWVSNSAVADVNVASPRRIELFGKESGEATVLATAADGSVIYGAKVRVSQNITTINEMLHQAMPDANISVAQIGQMAVINGTVASPEESAQAEQLVRSLLNPGINPNDANAALKIYPVNRLKTATPQQVMLQVKIAEVSRSLVKNIGVNLLSRDTSGGFLFGVGQGHAGTIQTVVGQTDPASGAKPGATSFGPLAGASGTTLTAAGHLLGLDLLSTLNLSEDDGKVRTLAEPNLTALSGETASFLAGGEFPILTTSVSGTNVEYKQYGVSLAFTPTVLDGGRISMRVRPEVSELSAQGAVTLNGISIPALTTRRAETTVELGSGQSFMIGGLMRNNSANQLNKAPFLGSIPILGALFRSNNFQRNETELVIIVTPYLVRPVNASQIALPTDGFREATAAQRVFLNTDERGQTGVHRPVPTVAPANAAPAVGLADPLPAPPRPRQQAQQAAIRPSAPSAAPGFSF